MIQIINEQRLERLYMFHEYVCMPDHFHYILTPSVRGIEYAIKRLHGAFARRVNVLLHTSGQVFQHGYYDHVIRNQEDYNRIAEYIYANPVRAGLVTSPERYTFSSARNRLCEDSSIIILDPITV